MEKSFLKLSNKGHYKIPKKGGRYNLLLGKGKPIQKFELLSCDCTTSQSASWMQPEMYFQKL